MMEANLALPGLETKFCRLEGGDEAGAAISGYASLFGTKDQGGDIVGKGAFDASLKRRPGNGAVKMLWQHDPARPIGVWDEIREDERGLFVRGHLLEEVQAGREALALLRAGAIDGLSIGYRALKSARTPGGGRILHEVELWEVSLVTFPMLPEARIAATGSDAQLVKELTETFEKARALLA